MTEIRIPASAGDRPAPVSQMTADAPGDGPWQDGLRSDDASGTHPASPAANLSAEALQALDRALDELADRRRPPTASQVRLAMKRVTFDGFDPRALGFKRFRDFLEAAAAAKRIELHDRPGDVLVTRRGSVPAEPTFVRVRSDLWRAALDWSADVSHYFDLDTDKTVKIPTAPVPLEPAKFARIRSRIAGGDTRLVRIPSIDIHTQVAWMEQFSLTVSDPDVALRLGHALTAAKPAREFVHVLRDEPEIQDVWDKIFGTHVIAHLRQWRAEDPRLAALRIEATPAGEVVDESSVDQPEQAIDPTARDADTYAGRARQAIDAILANEEVTGARVRRVDTRGSGSGDSPLPAGSFARSVTFGGPGVAGPRARARRSQLRLALHRAIDRMPEEELARLVIPVGYLIDD